MFTQCPMPCTSLQCTLVPCVPVQTPSRMCPSKNQVSLFHDRNIIFRWQKTTPIMLHSAISRPQSHVPVLFTTGQISTNCTVQFYKCCESQQNFSHWDFTRKFLLLETNLGRYSSYRQVMD